MAGKQIQIKARQKEIIIKIGVGVALIALLFLGLIRPAMQTSAKLRLNIKQAERRIELFQNVTELKKEKIKLEEPLSFYENRSILLGRISDITKENQVQVQSMTPKVFDEGPYVVFRVEVQAQTTFFDLIQFLKVLETFEPPIAVRDVSLLRRRDADEQTWSKMLQIQIMMETVLLKEKPARKKK